MISHSFDSLTIEQITINIILDVFVIFVIFVIVIIFPPFFVILVFSVIRN